MRVLSDIVGGIVDGVNHNTHAKQSFLCANERGAQREAMHISQFVVVKIEPASHEFSCDTTRCVMGDFISRVFLFA